jgi:hypothetical protein
MCNFGKMKKCVNSPQKLFVSGSKSISKLSEAAIGLLDDAIKKGMEILVGDCYGVDAAIQKYLDQRNYANVTVYCSGEKPRNYFLMGGRVRSCADLSKGLSGRAFNYVKDVQMCEDCDRALMIWDGKSEGTRENIKRMLDLNKPFLVDEE